MPLACAPALVRIAEREPLLADLAALWLADRPHDACGIPCRAGRGRGRRARGEWTDDDGQPLHPVAYSVGGSTARSSRAAYRREARGGGREARRHAEARRGRLSGRCPRSRTSSEYDWEARRPRSGASASASPSPTRTPTQRARSAACSNFRGCAARDHRYVTDAEWLADRLVQKIAAHVGDCGEKKERERDARAASAARRRRRRRRRAARERERQYEARVSGRARNLDLGAALARWEPKLDTDAVKLLGSLVLVHYGKAAAWAHRLCVEQPTTTNKQGKVTVRYPRGAQAEKRLTRRALAALMRGRARPKPPSRSSCACSSRSGSSTPTGLPDADRQGVYEPRAAQRLEGDRQARQRVAPHRQALPSRGRARQRESARPSRRPDRAAREARAGERPLRCCLT